MNTKITCRFGSQAALDDFNTRNGCCLTKNTKQFNVATGEKVEKKTDRDWWKEHYWQLPMYESHDDKAFATIDFLFAETDLELANRMFDQSISEKTKSVWFPKLVPGWHSQLRVIGGCSEHRYPIYVISKGRWDKCYTSRFLTQMEVKHFVVCEPQEFELYK